MASMAVRLVCAVAMLENVHPELPAVPQLTSAVIEEKVRSACPVEVSRCEEEAACKAEFAQSFSNRLTPEDELEPSAMITAIIDCFNAHVRNERGGPNATAPPPKEDFMLLAGEACPKELAACVETGPSGCETELQITLAQPSAPKDGSKEVLAVIRCMKRVARKRRKQSVISGAQERCPEQVAACEAVQGCGEEMRAALSAHSPPQNPSEPLSAVIECLSHKLTAERRQLQGGGSGGQRPSFRPEKEMSTAEKEVARQQMVERIAADVSCDLCALLVDDLYLSPPAAKEGKRPAWLPSDTNGGGNGGLIKTACATSVPNSREAGAAAAPHFRSAFSVHPCTRAAVEAGRCKPKQNYHLQRAATVGGAYGQDEGGLDDSALKAMYERSTAEQEAIDGAVFAHLCQTTPLGDGSLDASGWGTTAWLENVDKMTSRAVCKASGLCSRAGGGKKKAKKRKKQKKQKQGEIKEEL